MAKTKQEILAELKANPSYKPTSTLSPTKQAILQDMKLVSKTGFNANRSRITANDVDRFKTDQNDLANQTGRMNSFAVNDESDLEIQRRLVESTRDMSLKNTVDQQKMGDYAVAKKVTEEPEYGTGFIDTTRANLGVGQLQQDSSLKWSKYINEPTLENKRSAEAMDQAYEVYRRRQEQALYEEDAEGNLKERGNWISKDVAQYLPQFADQMEAQVPAQIGALAIGALTGGAGYASAAQVLGAAASGKQSFDVMRGAAYRGLKEIGVSDELALKISGEEALINAVIESAGTLAGMKFLGFGKLFSAIGSIGAQGVASTLAKQGMEKAAQSSLGKIAQVLAKYGITGYLGNIGSEAIEEGLQEGVSIFQEKRAMAQEGIERATTAKEDFDRVLQSAAGGAKIAAVMGGPGVAISQSGQYLINKNNGRVNETLARDVRTAKSETDAQDAGIAAKREKIVQSYDKGLDELFRNVGDQGTAVYSESINDLKPSDSQKYKAEFIKAYNAGLSTQKSFEEASLLIGSVENTERAKRFFEAGQKDSARIREESAALWKRTQVAVKKERATFVANQQPGLLNDEYSAKLDTKVKQTLDIFARETGTKIVIAPNVGSVEGKAVVDPQSFEGFAAQNGFYDPKSKSIYLNADLDNKTFGVTVHEITHTIKDMNDPGYKAFSDLALKAIEDTQGKDAFKRYATWAMDTYGVEMSIDQAKEELVSNEMARVLNDPEKFLAKYGKIEQNFGQRIVNAVRNVLRKIKKAFANRSLSKEARAELSTYEKQMEEMESKWIDALKGAKEAGAVEEGEGARFSLRERQFDAIQESNPMQDDIHTGIRSLEDILTFEEAIEIGSFAPDYTEEMAQKALLSGNIVVYSSKPIGQGIFVTPSRQEAEAYAGGGRIFSRRVELNDIAWIDTIEGQYAKVEETKGDVRYSLRDSEGRELTAEQAEFFKDSKVRDAEGNLLRVYHGTRHDFNKFDSNVVGGLFNFTPSKGHAENYALSGGGFRKRSNASEFVLVDRAGNAYEWDKEKKQYLATGYIENDVSTGAWKNIIKDKTVGGVEIGEMIDIDDSSIMEEVVALNKKSNIMEVYLNLENPLDIRDENTSVAVLKKIREGLDDSGMPDGILARMDNIIEGARNGIYFWSSTKYEASNRFFANVLVPKLRELGYDGLKFWDDGHLTYSAFEPEQIKSIDNKNPTENPDIRYSLRGSSELEKENRMLKERYDHFKRQMYQTKGKPDAKKVAAFAEEFLAENSSKYDPDMFAEKAMEVYEALAEAKNHKTDPSYLEYAEGLAQELALEVLNRVEEKFVIENESAAEIKNYLKKIVIIPTHAAKEDVAAIKRKHKWLKFASEKQTESRAANILGLDVVYGELVSSYPDIFDAQERNPEGMLKNIVAAAEAVKVMTGGYIEDDMSFYAPDTALQILAAYEEVQADETFADKQKAMRERDKKTVKLEANAKLYRIQKQADARIKQISERETQKKNKVIRNTYERIEASGLRKSIHKQINKLNGLAKNPTDQKHLPMPLENAITDLIAVLRPIESGQSVRDTVFGDRESLVIKNAVDAFRRIEAEEEGGDAFLMDVDLPDNLSDLGEILKRKSFNSVKAELRMNMDELRLMYETLASVLQMINYQNKLFSFDVAQQITDVSQKIANEIYTENGYENLKSIEWAKSLLNVDMLAPADFADRLGVAFKKLYDKGIREGLDKKIRLLKEAEEYMIQLTKGMDIEKWSGTKAEPITAFGLTMTPAQWMSIYVSARQEQARQHMIYGGVRPTEYEAPGVNNRFIGRTVSTYEPVQLTDRDIESLGSLLSAEQKRVAIGVSDFFMTHVAEWGNEVSEKMYGYRKFTEQNYFPIVSDPNFLVREQIGQASTEKTLRNMGSTKKRLEGAKNPIYAEDIFDVYSNHVDKYSSYNGFVPGLADMQRIYNAQVMQGTVKGLIEKRYGGRMKGYFKKLMVDINGGMRKEPEAHPATWLISRYKSAKIGANLKVVVQQPTTLVRAAAMIDPKYLIEGLTGKADWETVKKYAPIAQWKDWGYFTLDVGRQLKNVLVGREGFKDKVMKPIEAADRFAWLKLWRAVELEVTDKQPELNGEAFLQAVGARFSEIVDRTQVVDTVLHRTGIMRGDAMARSLTSFMSEPMKNYNLVKTAWDKYSQNKTPENLKSLRRSAATVFVTTAVTGVAVVMMGMYRDKEDTEEDFFKRFSKDWLLYVVKEPAGMVPLARDVLSLIEGYSVERMDMSLLASLLRAMGQLGDNKLTPAERARRMFVAVSELTGMPTGSASREVSDLTRNLLTVFDSYEGRFAVKALEYDIRNVANVSEFVDILFEAHKGGDIDSYDRMAKTLMENGITYDTIESRMKSRYKARLKKTGEAIPAEFAPKQATSSSTVKVFEVTKESLKPIEAEHYSVAYRRYLAELNAEVKDEPIYQKGDDDLKAKIENAIMDYSDSKAMAEASKLYVEKTAWIGQVDQAEIKADLSAEAFIAFLEGRKDYGASVGASGVTQEETVDFIDDQEYTRQQKAALWAILYPTSKNPFIR